MNLNTMKDSILSLINNPTMRPFLFRTRFERSMIRVSKYALETDQSELYNLATCALDKMHSIVDKSNTTGDGVLLSYCLLVDDMKKVLNYISE